MIKKRIIVACGTAIATATLVVERLKNILSRHNIDAEIIKCRIPEVTYYIKMLGNVDLIVATSEVPGIKNIPVLNAVPLISGIGIENIEKQIVSLLSKNNAKVEC